MFDRRIKHLVWPAAALLLALARPGQAAENPPQPAWVFKTGAVEMVQGAEIFGKLELAHPLTRNEAWQGLVERVGRRIVAVTNDRPDLQWQFCVLDWQDDGKPVINAFAVMGGYVVLTEAQIQLYEEKFGKDSPRVEELVASCLAHEVAHVSLRHAVNQDKVMGQVDRWVKNEKVKAQLEAALIRANEFEADQYGALYLTRAGYPYSASIEDMKLSQEVFGDFSPDDYAKVTASLRSPVVTADHPTFAERIAGLEQFREQLLALAEVSSAGTASLFEGGDPAAAVSYLSMALTAFPDSVFLRNNLGVAYHKLYLDTLPPEEQKYQSDLSIYVVDFQSAVQRGDLENLERAIRAYREVLAQAPDLAGTLSNLALANVLRAQADPQARLDGTREEALYLARRAVAKQPDAPQYLALGVVEQECGNFAAALQSYTQSRERWREAKQGEASAKPPGPDYLPALYNLALAQEEADQKEAARATWTEYAQRDLATWWGQQARTRLTALGGEPPPAAPSAEVVASAAGISLRDADTEVEKKLGTPAQVQEARESQRWNYPDRGLTVVLKRRKVQAISVIAPFADPVGPVQLGQTAENVRAALGPPLQITPLPGDAGWAWDYTPRGLRLVLKEEQLNRIVVLPNATR